MFLSQEREGRKSERTRLHGWAGRRRGGQSNGKGKGKEEVKRSNGTATGNGQNPDALVEG